MSDFSQEKKFSDEVDPRLARFLDFSEEEPDGDDYSLYARIRDIELRYTPIEIIATGGMKKISRVHDARADRYVAMAQLLDDAPKDLYEPFLREACLTARLEHPNIISIYNIGVDNGGLPFFTMELKVGDSLSSILKKLGEGDRDYARRYPLEDLLKIFVKVCDAVAYAHAQGVLHLDLKPSNIQVAPYGEVKVCDWGLGRFIAPNEEQKDKQRLHFDLLNSTPPFGTALGTPGFMAPEQVERGGAVSFQTDIYALGVILYSMLALKAPFSGRNDEIIQATLADDFPALSHSVSSGLRAMVRKATARNPADRYGSVEEFNDDVRHHQNDFPTSAECAGLWRTARLLYKRNRRIIRVAMLGSMVVALVTTAFEVALKERERRVAAAYYAASESQVRYEQEQAFSADMQRIYSGKLLFVNKLFSNISDSSYPLDEIIYKEMRRQLEVAGELNPKDAQPRVARAIILFVQQRFNEAAEVLETTPNWAWELRDLAREYGAAKTDGDRLTVNEMARFIRELRQRSERPSTMPLIEKMSTYDLSRRSSLTERAVVVEAVLSTMNPEWNERIFEYDAERRSLVIGGEGLRLLSIKSMSAAPATPLRWLRLHTLEVRNIQFNELVDLFDLPLVRLDIREVKGEPYGEAFGRFRMLDELVVKQGQLAPHGSIAMPTYITLVEEADVQ